MFSWICPQCGRDVPPSKTDCPYCAEQAAALAAAPVAAGAPAPEQQQAAAWQQPAPGYGAPPAWPPQPPPQYPPQPQYAQPPYPPPQYPPQQPAYTPPPPTPARPVQQAPPPPPPPAYAAPQLHPAPPAAAPAWAPTPTSSAPPTWLVALGFAGALLLVGGAIWFFVLRSPDSGSAPAKTASAGAPAAAASATNTANGAANPYQKYVEVVGVRMFQEAKKPMVKFVVVNHSQTEIDNLEVKVRLSASTSRSDEDSVGSFSFKLPELAPNSSKDLTEPLTTKMKMYELPDWQNTTAVLEITSPTQ
jgi:hypothetical protein